MWLLEYRGDGGFMITFPMPDPSLIVLCPIDICVLLYETLCHKTLTNVFLVSRCGLVTKLLPWSYERQVSLSALLYIRNMLWVH